MMQKYQKWEKYFITFDYDKFTNNIINAKIIEKNK